MNSAATPSFVQPANLPNVDPPTAEVDIASYEQLLEAAVQAMDGKDYANSTVLHAQIAIRKILEISKREVRVFSTSFRGDFWISLLSRIEEFLTADPNRRFSVITATSIDRMALPIVDELQASYPNQFSIKTLKKGIVEPESCPNFLFGDDASSRYEDNDRDAQFGLVSAIVSFGNTKRVGHMREMFDRLELHTA